MGVWRTLLFTQKFSETNQGFMLTLVTFLVTLLILLIFLKMIAELRTRSAS